MALINTEEGAKRLARVILSDIELYSRERPQAGQTLDTQIEEGRKLFGSRVAPEVVPLWDIVLADRRAASSKAPPVTGTPAPIAQPATAVRMPSSAENTPVVVATIPAEAAKPLSEAPPVWATTTPPLRVATPLPVLGAPPQVRPAPENGRTPAPVLAVEATNERTEPVEAESGQRGRADRLAPGDIIAAVAITEAPVSHPVASSAAFDRVRTPGPLAQSALPVREETPAPVQERTPAPVQERTAAPVQERTPAPVQERTAAPVRERTPGPRGAPAFSPMAAMAKVAPSPEPAAPVAAVAATERSVPVLTSRISIPKLLAVVAMAASVAALFLRYLR